MYARLTFRVVNRTGKDNNALETNRIDLTSGQQQHAQPAPPPQRAKPGDSDNALVLRPHHGTSSAAVGPIVATVTAARSMLDTVVVTATPVTTVGGADTALTSPKRGDPPEELVPTHGAFFFALGCGSALIVTLVAVTSALAYKRTTNKSLLRSKSKESLQ